MPSLRVGTTLAYLAILAYCLSFLAFSCCAALSHNHYTGGVPSQPQNNILDQVLTGNNNNNQQMVEDTADNILMTEESSESLAPWLDRVRPRCFRRFVQLYSNRGEISMALFSFTLFPHVFKCIFPMKWQSKRIGFHLSEVNEILKDHIDKLIPSSTAEENSEDVCSTGKRVFVPLCGKALDMAYLVTKAQEVVGVEAIQMAVEEFAMEHPDLNVKQMPGTKDGFIRFEGNKIVLLKGDYFTLDDTKAGGKMDAIWDRGSMVAIPVEMREDYVKIIGKLMAPGGKMLLVSLERRGVEEAVKNGPPFSMTEEVVRGLFESQDWVESMTLLQQTDQLETNPEDRERYQGLDHLFESVFLIQAKKG